MVLASKMIHHTWLAWIRSCIRFPIVKSLLALFVLLLTARLFYIFAAGNFHEVVPLKFYRCSQLSSAKLDSIIKKNNIKTVVNLRGCCDNSPWYLDQVKTINSCDISQEDLSFSAGRLPSTKTINQLVEVIDRSEKPMLFHCHKGIDRTGMAVVMSLLLQTDTKLETALLQLSLYYGHLAMGRTAHIDEFFELYAEYLKQQKKVHSNDTFRNWVKSEYVPADCLANLTLLSSDKTVYLEQNKSKLVFVKATNISIRPWVMKPGVNAGIKLQWNLHKDDGSFVAGGFAGNMQRLIFPRENIDISLVLPSIAEPGIYLLRIDMNDPQHAAFHQAGSEILEAKVIVQ